MEFPPTIGVSGEVHEKKGIKYENNFGVLLSKEKEEALNDSQASSMSISRRGSFRNATGLLKSGTTQYPVKESNILNK